ncbi:acyltransferase [Neptunicella marina]|uniref:Acyltransferase n=1 Tax=Neptunicella marina TaxID=2125989 RepID=A0A8J6IWK6_9ALTE|nr:acyltransferase [Neptunicella marina]MBC3766826.1 acyltransferase [Neptunicella marina]
MLNFLPVFILFPLNVLLQIANLVWWGSLIIVVGLIKLVIPVPVIRRAISTFLNMCMHGFGVCAVFFINLTNKIEWDEKTDGDFSRQGWYLMMANHISWIDIMLLARFAARRMPATKFFIKQELIWVPFVGLGAWALDMPFMKRYSRDFVAKYPQLKGKDIEATHRACEKFKLIPTTIVNFVEGTRFTEFKQQKTQSPFTNLLTPKAGGIAFTLAAMGEQFSNIVDITLVFPDNPRHVMYEMLCGRITKIVIRAKVLPVDEKVIGDYFNDSVFRYRFQAWLNQLWLDKDQQIEQIKQQLSVG